MILRAVIYLDVGRIISLTGLTAAALTAVNSLYSSAGACDLNIYSCRILGTASKLSTEAPSLGEAVRVR